MNELLVLNLYCAHETRDSPWSPMGLFIGASSHFVHMTHTILVKMRAINTLHVEWYLWRVLDQVSLLFRSVGICDTCACTGWLTVYAIFFRNNHCLNYWQERRLWNNTCCTIISRGAVSRRHYRPKNYISINTVCQSGIQTQWTTTSWAAVHKD